MISCPGEDFFHFVGFPHQPLTHETLEEWTSEALATRRADAQQVYSLSWRSLFSSQVLTELIVSKISKLEFP